MADQVIEVKDFSAGIDDSYVGSDPRGGQAFTNLLIRSDLKCESRPGGTVIDDTYYEVPFVSTRKRVDSIIRFKDTNLYQNVNRIFFVDGSGWNQIQGPSSNSAFTTAAVEFDQNSHCEWNNHLIVTNDRRERPVFLWKDGADFQLRTMGLPQINSSGVTFGASGAASRLYVFVHKYEYTIDGVDFVMRSKVSATKTYSSTIPATINNIPVLANGATGNYDTANIDIEIYRTVDTGDTFYKVGEITNGTTTFVDNTSDANLPLGLLLYTDNEDLDYDQPPECKFVVQLNGCVYYLNIKDSLGDIYPYRLVQANADQIYAANEGNICDFDEDITGAAVAGQYVIVFTKNRAYRIEGTFDSQGNGGISKVEISRTSGCVSHKSIVQVFEGVFFAALDGFYFTDGFRTQKISDRIDDFYKTFVETASIQKRICGAYDPFDKRVYWGVSNDETAVDNSQIYVAHLYFGISKDVPFTMLDGGYWATNFTASALIFYDNQLVRGDEDGIVWKHVEGELNDQKKDVAVASTSWTNLPVIYDYRSVAFDFGDVTRRKWVTKIAVYSDSIAKAALTIYSNNDNTGDFKELAEIKSNSPVLWGDLPDPLWGDTTVRWNYLPIVSGIRRFPKASIRCSYKQIRITNAYTLVDSSDAMGVADVDATAATVTLQEVGVDWDQNIVDYFISFDNDNYTLEFKVIERTSDSVITLDDPNNQLVDLSAVNFKIKGYRKNEAIRLLSYSIIYQTLTPTQSPYRAPA